VQGGKTTDIAVKSSEAHAQGLPEPADPTRWTSIQDPGQPLKFSAPDLNGVIVSETDPRFQGKVVLVNITGSGCPNCHDEAPLFEELYRDYHRRGLEIVALSFEEAKQLKDPTRLRAFIKNDGLEDTVLIAGEPGDLRTKLPQAVNLNTWPATFFVGRDGLVQGAMPASQARPQAKNTFRLRPNSNRRLSNSSRRASAPRNRLCSAFRSFVAM
jgi:thiol-disulfide isomerase/thioredoxin